MNGEIPRKSYMRYFNVSDPVTAQLDRMDEDMQIEMKRQEKQVEYQRMMENSINAAAASGGEGGQEGGSDAGGTTPGDVEEQAQAKAAEWMQLQVGERRKAMDAMKAQNFNLYLLAKEIMNQKRSQGAAEGRAQVNQQAQQGAG